MHHATLEIIETVLIMLCSVTGLSKCQACDPGSFTNETGQSQCTPCKPGEN